MNKQPRTVRGIPSGGEFASRGRTESAVTVGAEQPERALTIDAFRFARRLHGTYDADGSTRYHEVMEKVFDLARTQLESSPEGQQQIAVEKEVETLSEMTGLAEREIRDIAEQMRYDWVGEPSSDSWNIQARDVANGYKQPHGTIMFIDSKMRAAAVIPKPSKRELLDQRAEVNRQIDALDINESAAAIKKHLPTAATMTVQDTHADYDGQQEVEFFTAQGLSLGTFDPIELFGAFDDIEISPASAASHFPMKHCLTDNQQGPGRSYNLAAMMALTPEDFR